MRFYKSIVLVAAVLGLSGCGVGEYLKGEDNLDPPAELIEFEQTLKLETLWSRSVGADLDHHYLKLRPAVANGQVFAADRKGRVRAFDAATGKEVWDVDTDLAIAGGPGTGEGLVLLGTSDGEVIALDERDGAMRWRARVSSEVLAPPRALEGVVVARTVDGKLVGLDVANGKRRWLYDRSVPVLTLRGTSTPALSRGAVVAGLDNGQLVALSLQDGRTLWETRVAVPRGRTELERMVDIDADPVIAGDSVYAVTFQGRVAAMDLRTGRIRWRRDMSSHTGLGLDGRSVYVSDESSHLWSLDRGSSASLWKQDKLHGRRLTSPAALNQYVVVGDFEGYVHWLRAEDGQFVARMRVDSDGILAPPVSDGDTIYIYGRGGTLAAIRPTL